MKVAVLAGGFGTRLSEETDVRPKPMVEVGSRPILWHIMKYYSHFGFNEFVIALGYKSHYIKEFFFDYHHLDGDMIIDLREGTIERSGRNHEDWKIHLIDTGANTETGGRVRRLKSVLGNETFMLTYGDGVGTIDLNALLAFHRSRKTKATITAVRPPSRFGDIKMSDGRITSFAEKAQLDVGWINGGFMVLEPEIFEHLTDDSAILEKDLLETLAREGELSAFQHDGFWHCMDNVRDRRHLEALWSDGKAPWKVWD